MTTFKRGLTTGEQDIKDSEAIGKVDDKVNQGDLGKLVKLSANSFELCVADDLIDGQIDSLQSFTVNDGFPFGTVKKGPRLAVALGAAGTAQIRALVVAGDQEALGASTAKTDPYINGVVEVAADQSTSASRWRIYEILGDASAANCKVIIERF